MSRIVVQYNLKGTSRQYDNTLKDLEKGGLEHPKGRLYHIAVKQGNNMTIIAVWESHKTFEEYNSSLLPLLEKNGIVSPEHTLLPVYNILH